LPLGTVLVGKQERAELIIEGLLTVEVDVNRPRAVGEAGRGIGDTHRIAEQTDPVGPVSRRTP
jgi:hypothetical protein